MRFVAAVAAWGVAFALTVLLAPAIQRANFVFFWVAVLFVAWYSGLVPAVLAAAGAVLAVQFWLVPPYRVSGPLHVADLLTFAIFVGAAATVSALASSVQTIPVWSAHKLLFRGTDPGYAPIAVVTLSVFALLLVMALVVSRLTRGRPVREAAFLEEA